MTVLRSGISTMVNSSYPSKNYSAKAALRIDTGDGYGLVQFGLPTDLRSGATVLSATLRLRQTNDWTTTQTMTVQRLAANWKVSTVTWNSMPGVTGSAHTVNQAGGSAGDFWDFDVATDVQAVVDGAKNHGWRVVIDSTEYRGIGGFLHDTYKPRLNLTWAYPPAAPTTLVPSTGAVSIAAPVLRFDAAGEFVSLQVQVDPAADEATPDYDTGEVATSDPQYDLDDGSYPGLSAGSSTQWRVRIKDDAGLWSDWSDWATFERINQPALSITQPPATISDPTAPIAFTLTGLTAWRVMVSLVSDPDVVLHDSGKVQSSSGNYTPPVNVFKVDGEDYRVTVRAWDDQDREATPGDPLYVEDYTDTTVALSAVVAGADSLAVSQTTSAPWVLLEFSRTAAPDGWAIYRDGVLVDSVEDATDWLVSGTDYEWTDWTAEPSVEHTWRAAPIVNDEVSSLGPTDTLTPTCDGLWLGDPTNDLSVVIWGNDAGSWAHGEESTVYTPLGASAPVRVTTALRGLEGTVSGVLLDVPQVPDYAVDDVLDALWHIKAHPANTYRLVAGDRNLPVWVYDVNPYPDPTTRPGVRLINVTLGFTQNGELPYDADL